MNTKSETTPSEELLHQLESERGDLDVDDLTAIQQMFGMSNESTTLEDVREMTQSLYNQIWADWYSELPLAVKATVEVSHSTDSAGFSLSKNLLLNPIGEGNLADSDVRDVNGWPVWKLQLVHEMLHEWQFKKPCLPSNEATELHSKLWKKFIGNGHGPDFFQAIIEKAPYFHKTPELLIEVI